MVRLTSASAAVPFENVFDTPERCNNGRRGAPDGSDLTGDGSAAALIGTTTVILQLCASARLVSAHSAAMAGTW